MKTEYGMETGIAVKQFGSKKWGWRFYVVNDDGDQTDLAAGMAGTREAAVKAAADARDKYEDEQ